MKSLNHISVQMEPFMGNRVLFLLSNIIPGGRVAHAQPLTIKTVTPEEEHVHPEPTFSLEADEVQALVDRLHALGFRPSHAVNEQSALPFISAHLEDMRRLVFERVQETTRAAAQGGPTTGGTDKTD